MANQRYDNFVLENRLKDQLATKLEMLNYVTIDDTLTEAAGMIKKINVYKANGEAEDVAEGEGNSQYIEMSYTPKEYKVGTTQARFVYTDEDSMADPYMIDAGVQKLTEGLVNALYKKVNAEYWNATKYIPVSSGENIGFDHFADAIALFGRERDEEVERFALCNPSMAAKLRKALKDLLKYNEDFVHTGYIGTVAGVPVIGDKLVPDGCVILATKAAVTYFRKKSVETEQDRDMNTRKNILYGRQVGVVAFTDSDECVIIAPAGTAPTITTATINAGEDVAVAGSCAEGARIEISVNGIQAASAVVNGTNWSATIPKVNNGDVVTAIAYAVGSAAAESEGKTAGGK